MQIKLTPQEARDYLRKHFGVDSSVQIIIEDEETEVSDADEKIDADDGWYENDQVQGVAPPCLKLDDKITVEFCTGTITTGYASDWGDSWNIQGTGYYGCYIARWKYGWN